MQTIIRTLVILLSPVLLPSCSNALYFYETDKISLTVDARPDSSQPVQGNLGIKQRVALITPATKSSGGTKPTANGSACNSGLVTSSTEDSKPCTSGSACEGALVTPSTKNTEGDALSSISSFRFKITHADFPDFNPVSIQTAFITGDAASGLDPCQTIDAANILALSGELVKQNDAIAEVAEIKKLPEGLKRLFTCNGYSDVESQALIKRYKDLNDEAFEKAFKSDFRFEAKEMLNKYKQCAK